MGQYSTFLKKRIFRRLRQENCLNPESKGYSKLRSHHCTPAWGIRVKLSQKKKKMLSQQEMRKYKPHPESLFEGEMKVRGIVDEKATGVS